MRDSGFVKHSRLSFTNSSAPLNGQTAVAKTISKIIQSRAIHSGHTIEIELGFSDGSQDVISCPYHLLPGLAQAVRQAGALAEHAQKALPGQAVQLEQPYRATACNTGVAMASDGPWIAIRFATTDMIPVAIAMQPNLAKDAIQQLELELENLDKLSAHPKS
jgi:hypothetical protein